MANRNISDRAGATRDTLNRLNRLKRERNLASAAEQVTGEKWIDGSEIYRKVFSGITGPNAGSVTQAHGVTTPTVIRLYGIGDNGTNQLCAPNEATNEDVGLKADNTNVSITSATNLVAYTFHVVMEYIKP